MINKLKKHRLVAMRVEMLDFPSFLYDNSALFRIMGVGKMSSLTLSFQIGRAHMAGQISPPTTTRETSEPQ